MEKPKGRRRNMKSHLCIPRLRGNTYSSSSSSNNRLSPMSLLERFREAVFRLIMLTALSKATHQTGSADVHRSYYPADPHHSEAVADCIEFIKKSASTEETRDSSASSSIDATTEVIIPVPVM